MGFIYLDNNATTSLDREVIATMLEELAGPPSNPSSLHFFGREAKERLFRSKSLISYFLNIDEDQIYFTSSATEGLNWILRSLPKKGHIISSYLEHASVLNTLKVLEQQGYSITYLVSNEKGDINPLRVEEAIRPDTVLIILSGANSETGVKNDIEALALVAVKHQVPLALDGVALLGKDIFSIPQGVSAMVFSSHKIHGPKGVGLVYKRKEFKLLPLLTGGGQEKGLRSGTENLAAIMGFAKAIDIFYRQAKSYILHMQTLKDYFEERLRSFNFGATIHGKGPRLCNTTCVSFEGIDAETLLIVLDDKKIAASQGTACRAGALEPSLTLIHMGIPLKQVKEAVRFSLSRFTTLEEIDRTLSLLDTILKSLR